jgi:Mg-chelatase subunit ChlD
MKLPPAAPVSTDFRNAPGSAMAREFAMAARENPDAIPLMAETTAEKAALEKEALARQYVLVVDRSYSMTTPDGRGTRWTSACSAVQKLIGAMFMHDVDNCVPVYVFDHETTFVGECTDARDVLNVFKEIQPRGSTDLAGALCVAMEAYTGARRPNYAVVPGTTFVVIIDGATDDNEAVKRVLQRFADPANGYVTNHTQIAVSFIQIGDDAGATRFLQDLDDNLKPLDIVDTKKDDILGEPGGVDRVLFDAIFD